MSRPTLATAPKTRLYYLDWLRVLAMIGIFLFHNARFYDVFSDWHVKNASTNLGASILVAFMGQWIMPLFFLIAGAGTYYALAVRGAGQFARERCLRLLVPLAFSMVAIVVPQAYFEAVHHGETLTGNFFQLYGQYLMTLPELRWYHLWFLAYLFVFSLITLPILVARRVAGRSVVSRVASVLDKPGVLLPLLVLSLTAVDVFLYPGGFWGNRDSGGWNIVTYLLFFIFGYLIFANEHIMEKVKKLAWVMLGIALVAAACEALFFFDELANLQANFGSGRFIAAQAVQTLNSWCWFLAILGLGSRFLNRNDKFLTHANEAVLPFYILHQTIIIVIGFYVVQWNTGIGLKYLTISTSSLVAIMLIYEFLVRRMNVIRFLFGMRPLKPTEKPRAALAGTGQT